MADINNPLRPPVRTLAEQIYGYLADDEDARVCKDIPDSACSEQPLAFSCQLVANTLTQIGDALSSPKLVLAWMLSSIGAPAYFIAMLVPVRESLSLLPQLFVAQRIREQPRRKYFWVWGSIGQGVSLLMMLPVVLLFDGLIAGVLVILLLSLFSLSRGVCSVAYKDVLGKTVSKTRRGRLSGSASSAAGLVTLAVALCLLAAPYLAIFKGLEQGSTIFLVLLLAAAILWFLAALVYRAVPEVAGATEGGGNAFAEAIRSLALLRDDARFRDFVIARALLVSTAFSIPYIVVLIQRSGAGDLGSLGTLMLADGAAGLLSGMIWGRLSDQYSNRVMAFAGAISVVVMLTAVALYTWKGWLSLLPVSACVLFSAAVAHQGARVARKTYLVDMAASGNRAQYTAVSNTVIGLFLLAGGGLGVIDTLYGTVHVLLLLAGIGLLGVVRSLQLPNVQAE
ncbi:MAG: MFS transporter [Pseudomonadota bacterium]